MNNQNNLSMINNFENAGSYNSMNRPPSPTPNNNYRNNWNLPMENEANLIEAASVVVKNVKNKGGPEGQSPSNNYGGSRKGKSRKAKKTKKTKSKKSRKSKKTKKSKSKKSRKSKKTKKSKKAKRRN